MIEKYTFKQESDVKLGIFIPGRLSSERLPRKLVLPLNKEGDTLWDIACKKLNSLPDRYTKVALCQDKELLDIANRYYNISVVVRDEETAKAEGPMSYIFKDLEKAYPEVTHWMFLNPCLSQLKIGSIKSVLAAFEKTPFTFATSAKKYQNWLFTGKADQLTPIDYNTLSTKEIYDTYEAAHAFHIFSKEFLFTEDKNSIMKGQKTSLFIISKDELLDVDTPEDYEYLKYYINKAE